MKNKECHGTPSRVRKCLPEPPTLKLKPEKGGREKMVEGQRVLRQGPVPSKGQDWEYSIFEELKKVSDD